jgi:hypothetical protein
MSYRYQERAIKFKFQEEQRDKLALINGDCTEFSRMMDGQCDKEWNRSGSKCIFIRHKRS